MTLVCVEASSGLVNAETREFQFRHPAMGGEFVITIQSDTLLGEELGEICREAFALIDGLEARASSWREDSTVSRIKQQAGIAPVAVDEDIWSMLEFSRAIHAETDGVFDPTIGPVLSLWGKYRHEMVEPTPESVKHALGKVGLNKVVMDKAAGTVFLPEPGMSLDFGGIAKGLALDQVKELLLRRGIRNAYLNAATSSIVAIGVPEGKQGWTVTIDHPYNEDAVALDKVVLRDSALATSANRDRNIKVGDKQYGHIVDPRTGWPAESNVLSATVAGPNGMTCDALSTAAFIMGVERTRKFCREHPEYRAILVIASGEREAESVRINFPAGEEQQ